MVSLMEPEIFPFFLILGKRKISGVGTYTLDLDYEDIMLFFFFSFFN